MSTDKKRDEAYSQLSDEKLMRAYSLGDYGAFEELYKRHSGKVFNFLSKKLTSKEMIEDVFQVTFLQLHASRAKYNSSLPFLPWLFTLCRNTMIDSLRAKERVKEVPQEDIELFSEGTLCPIASPPLDSPSVTVEEWSKVLSPKEREVLSLRFSEDFSFDEIARKLGINSPSARKISQRGIQKLKSIWK